MTDTAAQRARGVAILLWGLRTLAVVIVVAVLGLGVALPLLTAAQPGYESRALVVARQLAADPKVLPRYGEAVFASDSLHEQVARAVGLPEVDAAQVADRLDIIAAEDSIVYVVLARGDQPLAATQLADVAAAAFASELNKGGSGIGTFVVQGPPSVPTALRSPGLPLPLAGVLGLVAGLVFSVGLIALLAAIRRPVLQPSDAETIVGRPVLGVVVIPHGPVGSTPDPRGVKGLLPLARALVPLVGGAAVLASSPQATPVRHRLLALLAPTLAGVGTISVDGPSGLHAAIAASPALPPPGTAGVTEPATLDILDGAEPLDSLTEPHRRVRVVIVVPYGQPAATVRRVAQNYLDEEVLGVVIVDERTGPTWRPPGRLSLRRTAPAAAARRTATGIPATATSGQTGTDF